MSNLSKFLKSNKKVQENAFYAPTKSLLDDDGTPLKWEFRHINSRETEEIRERCTTDIPVTGKPGMYRQKLDSSKYLSEILVASIVEPDLYNAELQDSYGVKKPEELLLEMVDNPGEYQDLVVWIQKFQGFESMDEKVEKAKN